MYKKSYSAKWDADLNHIMMVGKIISVDDRLVVFECGHRTLSVHITDRWYAFGYLEMVNGVYTEPVNQFRPKFSTMNSLWDMCQRGNK